MGDTEKKKYIIGIDFGTSFSQVAIKNNGVVSRICDAGNYGVPSLFFYSAAEGELVGKRAKDQATFEPENLVKEVKMSLNDKFTLDAKEYSAKEIVSKIYGALVSKANERGPVQIVDFNLGGIVITHPAEFKMPEVNLLKDAAENCLGASADPIKVVGTIKEPVAAALTYFENAKDKIQDGDGVMVFDLGGGTCDIALVVADKNQDAEFDVKDVGMLRIGGRDWDKALFDYVAEKIEEMTDGERVIVGNPEFENEVYEEVNEVKHTLTLSDSAFFRPRMTYHPAIAKGIKITRGAFEELTESLLNQTMDLLHEVYERNKDTVNIKHIICVGGSSNMPMVERTISAQFPDCEVKIHEPEYAVVSGAAIYASKLEEMYVFDTSEENIIPDPSQFIQDILPFSYGVRCLKNGKPVVKTILKRGSKFPVIEKCSEFKISNDSKSIQVEVYETSQTEDVFDFDDTVAELVGTIKLVSNDNISTTERIECELIMNDLSTISINIAHDKKDTTTATFDLVNKI